MLAPRTLLAVVLVGLFAVVSALLAGCADEDTTPTVDRSDPAAVAKHFLGLLAKGDLATLRPWMTKTGFGQLERDMRLFQKQMQHERDGPKLAKELRRLLGERGTTLDDRRWQQVARGGEGAALALLLEAYPMPDPPQLRGFQTSGGASNQARFFFQGAAKQNFLLLQRDRGEWQVEALSFP